MPGVPICDLLDRVYKARQAQENDRAYDLFGSLLPFINFTLQDFEVFLQVEKRLLVRRGLFAHAVCRSLTYSPSPAMLAHIDFLIGQMVRIMEWECSRDVNVTVRGLRSDSLAEFIEPCRLSHRKRTTFPP